MTIFGSYEVEKIDYVLAAALIWAIYRYYWPRQIALMLLVLFFFLFPPLMLFGALMEFSDGEIFEGVLTLLGTGFFYMLLVMSWDDINPYRAFMKGVMEEMTRDIPLNATVKEAKKIDPEV